MAEGFQDRRLQVPPLWPTVIAMPIAIDKHLNEPEEPGDEFVLYRRARTDGGKQQAAGDALVSRRG